MQIKIALVGLALVAGCSTAPQTGKPQAAATPTPVSPVPTPLPSPAQSVTHYAAISAEPIAVTPHAKIAGPGVPQQSARQFGTAIFVPPAVHMPPPDRERYQKLSQNPVQRVADEPVSTFSIDVDTGSYANVRRMLNAGALPKPDAVRVEEMINYFPYDYPQPRDATPFAVHTEMATAPWNPSRQLLRIAVKGKDVAKETLPAANLVFLVDVSGSMQPAERLPLIKSSLKLLVNALRPQDRISLVTYAGRTAIVLMAVPGDQKASIVNAIDGLQAGGSTAGASGIELAYKVAREGFIRDGINRILLATDGDFNVGVTNFGQLKTMVEEQRKSGVSLSTLGVGSMNYNEELMEQLADAGDGAYSYVDSLMEGHKVLVNEMTSTLATIAQDVKVQVEFNPAQVQEYRLIGYENRLLKREDFRNDKVDAGDIGAGHTITALYELTPAGAPGAFEPLRYVANERRAPAMTTTGTREVAFVRLRYKLPGQRTSVPVEFPVPATAPRPLRDASADFRFATAVAGFGELLRGGKYQGQWDYAAARELAVAARGEDRFGHRGEFLRLVELTSALATRPAAEALSAR